MPEISVGIPSTINDVGSTTNNNDICSFIDQDILDFLYILFLVCLSVTIIAVYNYIWNVPPFKFKLVSLDVASMTISNNSTSDINNYVSGDVKLALSFTNKNEQLIMMEPLLVSFKRGNEFLSSTMMDPFYAKSEENKTIELDMSVRASHLKDRTVNSMAKDLAINQAVEFELIIQGRYWISSSGHATDSYGVGITCNGVNVKFSPATNLTTGSMVDYRRSCDITITN